jgi:hypothetical protein
MMGKKDFKPRIFYRLSLEKMVPQDHLVRALEEVMDLGFVRGSVGSITPIPASLRWIRSCCSR